MVLLMVFTCKVIEELKKLLYLNTNFSQHVNLEGESVNMAKRVSFEVWKKKYSPAQLAQVATWKHGESSLKMQYEMETSNKSLMTRIRKGRSKGWL